jgi:hypothetical protein
MFSLSFSLAKSLLKSLPPDLHCPMFSLAFLKSWPSNSQTNSSGNPLTSCQPTLLTPV